jgi:hypothetical protein
MRSLHIPAEKLPPELHQQLSKVEPCVDGRIKYYPCLVVLKSGDQLDRVYMVPEAVYLDYWGVYPEDDPQKKCVYVQDIRVIKESPSRLPLPFAKRLYEAGESGMGYYIFTIVFSDGFRQAYQTGDAIDFLQYPAGYSPTDIVDVLPHEGRDVSHLFGAKYYWCLHA